jgi:hypothetical protein
VIEMYSGFVDRLRRQHSVDLVMQARPSGCYTSESIADARIDRLLIFSVKGK